MKEKLRKGRTKENRWEEIEEFRKKLPHALDICQYIYIYTHTLNVPIITMGKLFRPFSKSFIQILDSIPPHSTTSLLQSLYHRFSFLCST